MENVCVGGGIGEWDDSREEFYCARISDSTCECYDTLVATILVERESTTYQPSNLCAPKVFFLPGLWWTSTCVQGGTNGVVLKSNAQNTAAYIDKEGLQRKEHIMLRMRTAWGINLSQYTPGKLGS